jgi:hypothetical protein
VLIPAVVFVASYLMNDAGNQQLYHVRGPDRRDYGPITAKELYLWRQDRRVDLDSPVRLEGDEAWFSFRDFPELLRPPVPEAAKPPPVPLSRYEAERTIPGHFLVGLVLTLFSCMPLGMVALYYSARVAALIRSGDIEAAKRASRLARVWCWITFLTGFPASVLFMVGLSKLLGLS